MANIYLTFDFGTDEEKIQQARHKLDNWKLAMRLDKKLSYKFDRAEAANGSEPASADEESNEPAAAGKKSKAAKAGKAKTGTKAQEKAETDDGSEGSGPTKLYLKLSFSNHEKLTEQRWVDRIPGEEPFKAALPEVIKQGQEGYEEVEGRFEALE